MFNDTPITSNCSENIGSSEMNPMVLETGGDCLDNDTVLKLQGGVSLVWWLACSTVD